MTPINCGGVLEGSRRIGAMPTLVLKSIFFEGRGFECIGV